MLHQNAKQRLMRLIPDTFDIEWFDPLREKTITETVNLDRSRQIRWNREGTAIEYPCVYIGTSSEGRPRGDIGHMFEDGVYREDVSDDSIAYREYTAAPQRSTVAVTVAVKQGTERIPKHVVCDQIAIECWHEFKFGSDHLEEQGVDPSGEELDYAWPMGLRPGGAGMQDLSRTIDEQSIERRQFEFRVEYAYFNEEEVPATNAIEYRLGIDMDHDGEVTEDEYGEWRWMLSDTPIAQEATSTEEAHVPTISTE